MSFATVPSRRLTTPIFTKTRTKARLVSYAQLRWPDAT